MERGAKLVRRDEGAKGVCVTEEQRSQARGPARGAVLIQRV